MAERIEPADWALYLCVGLIALAAMSRVIVTTTPAYVLRALNDPTTVYFNETDMNGRPCKDMLEEAKRRGTTHWICRTWGSKR